MNATARIIKNVSERFNGTAWLYELSEPVKFDEPKSENDPPAKETKYIVVSATYALFSGDETYIFPADEWGNILDWCELEGSYRGGLDHIIALNRAGFEVIE